MAEQSVQPRNSVFIEKTPDTIETVSFIIGCHRDTQGGLIPVLQNLQEEFGYLPQWSLEQVSESMRIPLSRVSGVASFYSYFSSQPKGLHTVRVCLGTACYVRGGNEILHAVEEHVGVKCGQTSADGMFSVDTGRCFGACGLAPVIMIGDRVIQRVKPSKVREILDQAVNDPRTDGGTGRTS